MPIGRADPLEQRRQSGRVVDAVMPQLPDQRQACVEGALFRVGVERDRVWMHLEDEVGRGVGCVYVPAPFGVWVTPVPELQAFAFDRFAKGRTFGASNSHCPWV